MPRRTLIASLTAGLLITTVPAQGRGPVDEHAKPPEKAAPTTANPGKPVSSNHRIDKHGSRPRGMHRPKLGISPIEALQFLQAGNALQLKNREEPAWRRGLHQSPRNIERHRPNRSGRYIAATICSPFLPDPVSTLLATRRQDLLRMMSPGPAVRLDEVAALEQAATTKGLSLAVILVREQHPFLAKTDQTDPLSPAAAAMHRHRLAARSHSKRTGLNLAAAHGMLQAQILWRSSPLLRRLRKEKKFAVSVGTVSSKTGRITWITRWHMRPPLLTGSQKK